MNDEPEVVVMTCAVCGRPATGFYPDERSGEPSCEGVACELLMQAAEDHHNECGDR